MWETLVLKEPKLMLRHQDNKVGGKRAQMGAGSIRHPAEDGQNFESHPKIMEAAGEL